MTQDAANAGPATTIQKPHFDVAMRGYERSQVDEHLTKLHREVTQLTANLRQERDFARNGSQQLVAERDNLLQQLHAAQQELASLGGAEATIELVQAPAKDEISLFGDRLQTILTTAEQEANAAKAEAQEAADRTRAEATQEVETLLGEARQEADTLLAEATREAETLRSEAKQETDTLRAETKQETDTLRAEAKQETDTLRAETKRETDTLRAEAKRETDALRAEATEETDTLRAETQQAADALLAEARQRAAQLTEQASADAERITTSARQEATAMLDTARREESETRASLAELAQRREHVRRQLTDISSAIEDLLGDDGGTGPAASTTPATPADVEAGAPDAPEHADNANAEPTVARSSPQPQLR